MRAFSALEIEPHNIITISGIGCSGRFSHYLNTYSLHGTHGRALPTALGAKAARPELTVIAVGGDGDGLSIGGGHIPHAARKNVDITYLLLDNSIYGLTKGQTSPTTPLDTRTKTTPYGSYDDPMDAIPMFLSYNASFVARTSSTNLKEMTNIITKAIEHRGFSIVYILSLCKTFPILTKESLNEILQPLPENHDKTDKLMAMQMAYVQEPVYTGIFYQIEKSTLEDRLEDEIVKACKHISGCGSKLTAEQIMKEFA